MFVKHGQGLELFLFLLIECYGVGDSLAFVTFSRLDDEFFKLILSLCLINELKKKRKARRQFASFQLIRSSGVALSRMASKQLQSYSVEGKYGSFPVGSI